MATNPLRLDPTRTTTLRNQFLAEMKRRFNRLKKAVTVFVEEEDSFGLTPREPFTFNTRFQFETSAAKVSAFHDWLEDRIDKSILSVSDKDNPPWTNLYVGSAYKKGVTRSFLDVRKKFYGKESSVFEGTKKEFLRSAFNSPEALSKIELIYTRAYEQLKGISRDVGSKLSVVLADALSNGKGPRETARELVNTITGIEKKRALTLARTEIIHAHAEGQLDSLERLGVEELEIQVEWMTAGDSRVCPLCQELAGTTYTIQEARGKLPKHPNCRCAWVPRRKR